MEALYNQLHGRGRNQKHSLEDRLRVIDAVKVHGNNATARALGLRKSIVSAWVASELWVRRVSPAARRKLYRLPKGFKDTHAPATAHADAPPTSSKEEKAAMVRTRARFPEQERVLAGWIDARRAAELAVSGTLARQVMLSLVSEAAPSMDPAGQRNAAKFMASGRWMRGFMKRVGFSHRVIGSFEKATRENTITVPLPVRSLAPPEELLTARVKDMAAESRSKSACRAKADEVLREVVERGPDGGLDDASEPKVGNFRRFLSKRLRKKGIPARRIWNMDEVPMRFDMLAQRTLDRTGVERVAVKKAGGTMTSFTVVLTAGMGGRKMKPILIFRDTWKDPLRAVRERRALEAALRQKGINVHVAFQRKGWMDERVSPDSSLTPRPLTP